MSWQRSHAQQSGTNQAELVGRRQWGGSRGSDAASATPEPARQDDGAQDGPRKRKSRWGEKTAMAGLPTAISSNVKAQELDNYATSLRLEELNKKLRVGDIIPPERERSPSPPPTYDTFGRRTNSRDIRYRKKLETEREQLITRLCKNDPNFRPPTDYYQKFGRGRPQDKVYIPVKEFPEINFFGLLVGPRGNSLKKMERESGAKISIRGKGSVKDGKKADMYGNDEDEELHCLVQADHEDKVRKCVELINQVIETAASTPEGDNDHKRNQLRELALLNGTLRDDEGQPCQNCGKLGHRRWDCPEQRNFTANIICRNCGGAGHMARDCMRRADGTMGAGPGSGGARGGPGGSGNAQFDSEYASLMEELGEGPKEGNVQKNALADIAALGTLAPWRNPDNWLPPQPIANSGRNSYNRYESDGRVTTYSAAQPFSGGGYGGY